MWTVCPCKVQGYLRAPVVQGDMFLPVWCFGQGRIEQRLPMFGEPVQENNQGKAAV